MSKPAAFKFLASWCPIRECCIKIPANVGAVFGKLFVTSEVTFKVVVNLFCAKMC